MDEDQGADRFDMENDFEGGQWIGGEFYYSKKVEKRKQTRDDVLYGVFQESDSDSDGGRKRRRRDRGPVEKGDFVKPVNFVSSGKVVGSALEDEKEGKEGGGVDLGTDQNGSRAGLGASSSGSGLGFQSGGLGFAGGLGFQSAGATAGGAVEKKSDDDDDDVLPGMFGKRIQEAAERRKEREKEESQKSKGKGKRGAAGSSAAPANGIGSFEKHTKGIGLKLLQSMGYVPGQGLGAKGQGIAAPVEAKLRPGKNMGMGYNDYEERKTALPAPPGKEGEKAEAAAEPAKQEKLWKARNADKRRKKVYKTAGALIEEIQATTGTLAEPTKILDMRGPQVRVLTNMEALNAEQAAVEDDTPMPELQHNLRLMVDLAEAEIQQFDRKLRHEKDTMAVLAGEQERLLREVDHYRGQVEGLEAVLGAVEKVQEKADEGLVTLQGLADVFDALQHKHHEEYKMFNLAAVALSHVLPLMQAHFHGWNPFQTPLYGTAEMGAWKKLLAQEDGPRDYSIFTDLDSDIDPYTRLVREVILPPLRSLVLNSWEPRDPEPLLRFFEAWEALLPASVKENMYDQLVMPKLTAAVDQWDPRLETVPIHAWLHPWLPLLAARMEPLYAPIRFKLGAALQAWDPSDSSAYALLHPWQTVFDPTSWEQLLVRSILPKLVVALHSLVINPHAQQLEPFQWFIQWAGAVPVNHMVSMLEAHFFPKWQQVLYQWLCAGPNFDEVTRWYLGWKGLFPPDLLANPRVQRQLNAALDMMNQAVEGAPVVQPGARENMAYLKVSENRKFEQQQFSAPSMSSAPEVGQPVTSIDTGYDHGYASMSLKEIVEATAQQNDVMFLPKVGRLYQGLQVYSFGLVSVTIDNHNQMLYAQAGEKWLPVSLEQLVELNKTRTLERG